MEKLFQEAWDQGIKGISKYKHGVLRRSSPMRCMHRSPASPRFLRSIWKTRQTAQASVSFTTQKSLRDGTDGGIYHCIYHVLAARHALVDSHHWNSIHRQVAAHWGAWTCNSKLNDDALRIKETNDSNQIQWFWLNEVTSGFAIASLKSVDAAVPERRVE